LISEISLDLKRDIREELLKELSAQIGSKRQPPSYNSLNSL